MVARRAAVLRGAAMILILPFHLCARAADAASEPPVELYALRLGARARAIKAFGDAADLPDLREIGDDALRSLGRAVPIGEAHSRGLLHRGVWLFVRDARGRVMLMRRSERTVTCPSAWSLVGEHSTVGETWKQTARRALTEELGVPASLVPHRVELLGMPVLFRCDYLADGGWLGGAGRKMDLQATALLSVRLPDGVLSLLRFDADVAETRWTTLPSLARLVRLSDARVDGPRRAAATGRVSAPSNGTRFCNWRIRALLALALGRLQRHDRESRGKLLG
ncbi:hypothetical protein KFE25_005477 [Diacronema lutheri]|uniref:Nudix hydrolase domain-containing protein n=1 Tax=Diacronema lutheri TaxID=2081491 RepID=A0A7R9UQX7_DIALT|nr:hypothetical protein KFE25_005477 [Diacronema lutheri]|mmetsp:Transcript_20935/g.65076  ORF Transcript_20935/g.65076 Transcript_20935/m.65076 type:complete len:280 (+) Transcript_20935:37-876(+)